MPAIALDLLHFVKETQLQHGLRAENYVRYHNYVSNRVATLRRQLKLSNDKKKFLHKDVTTTNATDARYLMLLVLYAERCWAEAESMVEALATAKRQEAGGTKVAIPGGVPPKEQSRKRLNKAVIWATKLLEVASGVADARTQIEAKGYAAETRGRCALSHGRFQEARECFKQARDAYLSLQPQSNESQWPLVIAKIGELDDRVVYCMQCLGEDPQTYRPDLGAGGATAQFAVTVQWNRRALNIFSVKVKDTLREVQQCDWAGAKRKALDGNTGPVSVGAQNKALDVVDRCVGLYNDALANARTDLRGASDSQRQELQLLVHYLTYHAALYSLERTRFMLEVFERRYAATVEALRNDRGAASAAAPGTRLPAAASKEFNPSQYASPLEVARLCDNALETLSEMSLLPGVAGRDDVDEWERELRCTKLIYAAEAWRAAGDVATAAAQYKEVKAIAASGPLGSKTGALQRKADEALVTLSAEQVLQKTAAPLVTTSRYLSDAMDVCAVATQVAKFPPDFQAVPCKPVFVDVAATFIDYPQPSGSAAGAAASGGDVQTQRADDTAQPTNAADAPSEGNPPSRGKWGWGWGWGGKK